MRRSAAFATSVADSFLDLTNDTIVTASERQISLSVFKTAPSG
jgi:hypothetical protein